jgi:hypothetical protein
MAAPALNWASGGKQIYCRADTPTRFELEVEHLGLQTENQILSSLSLRFWARRNRVRYYIPEDYLRFWGMVVYEDEITATVR